ncbi:MAG: lipopolysaccharide transport periplasmic protein LptA [Sulfuriflexus sp.]|nr:lipopolysaccharide transport periplasmic protein LptA [Sulfuriflexus sp.]
MTNNSTLLALLITLLFPFQAMALNTDSDQPMNIEADRVDIDDEKGTNIFTGNVVITRGSIRISGDKVVVYRDKEKNLDKIHSTGNPAHFQQTPDNKNVPVISEAKELFYDAVKEILIMRRNGKIIQGGDTFTGDHIIYDSKRNKITAKQSKSTGGSKSGKGRVHITIQPKNKTKK